MKAESNTTTTTVGTDDQLTITVSVHGGTIVVSLTGELDYAVEQDLTDAFHACLAIPKTSSMRVDVSGVTFIDSSGIRSLLLGRETATERSLDFAMILGSNRSVLRVLAICGLLDTFEADETEHAG